MSTKKFYVSPETFTDFLLGRDVSARSIDLKGADHPIFKEAAGVFLGVDDEESCKAVHAYWIRRGQEIVRILKYETNVERKKQARLRYFLEMMGLKLIKREEILSGAAKDSRVTEVVSNKRVGDSRHDPKVYSSKPNFTISSNHCTTKALPKVVAMEVEIPECDVEVLEEVRNDSSTSINYDSEHSERGEEEDHFEGGKEDHLEEGKGHFGGGKKDNNVGEEEDEESLEDYLWKKEGEFPLSASEWRGISDKGPKLTRKWTSLISEKFFSVNSTCVIQFQGYHFNKQVRPDCPFLMMRGYCAHVSCKRFRVTMKSPPTENDDTLMSVWSKGSEKHVGEKKTRQLKGWDRLAAKRALALELAHMYRREKMMEADKSAIAKGNLQGVKSLEVLRRVRSEALRGENLM